MDAKRKTVAIVGGGFTGLSAIYMLREENMEPMCFEKTGEPGGTWCYREESVVGVPSTMPTTVINHCKELGAMSMHPPDKKASNYMPHKEMYAYIMSIAEKQNSLKYMKFHSEVIEVRQTSNYEETGQWNVTVKSTITGEIETYIFDAVLICVGHMNIPKYPSFKGQDKFEGQIIHTHSLKGVSPYKDKNVVVVGMGCSGLDAAVDLSSVAKQVYLSTRSGAHVFTRVGPSGLPFDFCLLRRYMVWLLDYIPHVSSWLLETGITDVKFNSRLYAVKPKYHLMAKDPVISDHLGSKILSGAIIQKRDITEITENGVFFDGESEEINIDVIVFATGYKWEFPFLEKRLIPEEKDGLNLYKCIWPIYLKHPTLAFVAYLLPFGASFPIVELQLRYVTQVLAGNKKLPSVKKMLKDVERRIAYNKARYCPSSKQSVRVDYVQYQDEIAELIGAKPNFYKMFFTDPQLFFQLMFGPSVPYQYRLQGPHSWSGAREAIMTAEERVLYPIKGDNMSKVEPNFKYVMKKAVTCILPFT